MSEEVAAFARNDENPFPIVPDDLADATEVSAEFAPPGETGFDPEPEPTATPEAESHEAADPVAAAILAPDSRHFIRALIGRLIAGSGDDTSVGIVLSRLGQALAEDRQDEHLTFQSLVDALDRGRVEEAALRDLTPIIAAFVARLVARETSPADGEALPQFVAAAESVVGETLESGGSRAWRRLPRFAATIAERAAQRELPLGAVAEMLPRLGARFGLTRREPAGRGTVISLTDDLRGDPPRGAAADEPRRMVISGPVEIVILDR
jgi:hypothetical protein